ncbi:MAG: SUMF1/EgtB/PvdO family nonheme iron enzyme, partial [Schlesneria sp.]
PQFKRFKIADFGIGGIQAEIDHRTRRAHTIGQRSLASFLGSHTPLYASSEQANGEKTHTADDIYALGVIWYQMLTGNMNLGAPTGTKWQERIKDRGLSDREAELLVWCFESRDDRPQNAIILLEELESICGKAGPFRDKIQQTPDPDHEKSPKPGNNKIPQPLISAPLDSFAEEMEKATAFAAAQNKKGQRLFDQFQYAEAAKEIEEIPLKLRNQQLYQEAVTRRERLVELEEQIRRLVKDHEYRKLINPVQEALRLFPGRPDFLKFQKLCPDVALRPGMKAGERTAIQLSGLEIPFRWCPPGSFTMGSPTSEPGHNENENSVSVKLTNGFWLGETVVTQELYKAVVGTDPSHFKGAKRSVEQVSWDDASTFCGRLSALLSDEGVISINDSLMLPTEAQWEYACRAGTSTAYSFGNDEARLDQYAWYDKNSGKETHPVATRSANPWG